MIIKIINLHKGIKQQEEQSNLNQNNKKNQIVQCLVIKAIAKLANKVLKVQKD